MITSAPAAWRTRYETGLVTDRDTRLYLDPRQIEYPDVGAGAPEFTAVRDLIDRGNCESTTAPMIYGETVPVTSNVTFARDATVAYQGSYSYKLTKTNAVGTSAYVVLADAAGNVDLHGIVPGNTYTFKVRMYIPSGGVQASEISLRIRYRSGGVNQNSATTPEAVYDEWQEVTVSLDVPANSVSAFPWIVYTADAALNEFIYVDNIRMEGYVIPGSHYLSGGYSQHILPLGLSQKVSGIIRFRPTFAFDTATYHYLTVWDHQVGNRAGIYYTPGGDRFALLWEHGGTSSILYSRQFDDGTTLDNIGQWMELAFTIDPTTGTTAGSAFWWNGNQEDTSWNVAVGAMAIGNPTLLLNSARGGAEQDFDIAYVRLWMDKVITDADVQNGCKDIEEEEIYFSMNGHATGRTRCNISEYFQGYSTEKNIRSLSNGRYSENSLSVNLDNTSGIFSDDQYATYEPESGQYNGTAAQAYLRKRCGIILEQWYGTAWAPIFHGRVNGFPRATRNVNSSKVSVSASDGFTELGLAVEKESRKWVNTDLVSATESSSLFHLIAHRADRMYRQYLADNSFENATLSLSWGVSGGSLTRQADPLFGTYCGQDADSGAGGYVTQSVLFATDAALNVGEKWNFSIFLKSAGAASSTIELIEKDAGGTNDSTTEAYSLSGGEGWVRYDVTHTITDSDSDRLWPTINIAASTTIKFDGAMLVRGSRAPAYFEATSKVGAGAEYNAYNNVEISWPWFGIDALPVGYTHPWRRMDQGSTVRDNLTAIADACGALYCGFVECDCLTLKGVCEDSYSEQVQDEEITDDIRFGSLSVALSARQANRIIGHGAEVKILANVYRQVWQASKTGHFTEGSGENMLAETIADGDYWPDADDYPEYWAIYEGARPGSTLTPETIELEIRVTSGLNVTPDTYEHTLRSAASQGQPEVGITPVTQNIKQARELSSTYRVVSGDHGLSSRYAGAAKWVEYLNRRTGPYSKLAMPGARVIGMAGVRFVYIRDGSSSLSGITRGNLASGVDVTTRADACRLLFQNSSGGAITLRDAGLLGYPVVLSDVGEGWIHDAFVDWDDIAENGERVFEFGSNDIIDKAQLKNLAEWYWKNNRSEQHLYAYSAWGERHWYQPGRLYRLNFGSAGAAENVDSVVECYRVVVSKKGDGLGETVFMFREVEENFKFDSNSAARYLSSAYPFSQIPETNSVIVGSSEYIGPAWDYCDGTADEVQINNAIDFLSNAYGGGTVVLTRGTYITADSIDGKTGVTIRGEGDNTTIRGAGTFDVIDLTGTSGTHMVGVGIRDLAIDSSSAVGYFAVDADYVDGLILDGVYIENVYGLSAVSCTDVKVTNNTITPRGAAALRFDTCTGVTVTGNIIHDITYSAGIAVDSRAVAIDDCVNVAIANNMFRDIINQSTGNADFACIEVWQSASTSHTIAINGNTFRDVRAFSPGDISGVLVVSGLANVTGNVFENMEIRAAGVSVSADNIAVSSNTFRNCALAISVGGEDDNINGNSAVDGGNLVTYAGCENATDPYYDASSTLNNCTFARSSGEVYEGTYSFLLTKTVAAGTSGSAYLQDNILTTDMHGLLADTEYTFGAWVYVPSASGIDVSEVQVAISDYVAAWDPSATSASVYDEWEYIEVTKTLNASATGARVYFHAVSTAANGEYYYVDNIRLFATGINNSNHTSHYSDGGTNTYANANSWQGPGA